MKKMGMSTCSVYCILNERRAPDPTSFYHKRNEIIQNKVDKHICIK